MDYQDSLKIIALLQANYPNFYAKQSAFEAEIMVQFWATSFIDYDYELVQFALQKAMLKNKFPPSIAEVNEEIVSITKHTETLSTGEEAWGKAQTIIRKYGSMNYMFAEDKEKMNKELNADLILARTVKAVGGLQAIANCEVDDLNTLRSQFIRIYDSYAKRTQESHILPPSMQLAMENYKKQYTNEQLTQNEPLAIEEQADNTEQEKQPVNINKVFNQIWGVLKKEHN